MAVNVSRPKSQFRGISWVPKVLKDLRDSLVLQGLKELKDPKGLRDQRVSKVHPDLGALKLTVLMGTLSEYLLIYVRFIGPPCVSQVAHVGRDGGVTLTLLFSSRN
jgi:hypothetical protein